jgi:leucine dehydrogenase
MLHSNNSSSSNSSSSSNYSNSFNNTSNSNNFESLHQFFNQELNIYAIIAINSTSRGPAIGGCRFISYNSLNEAIADALRLAKSMTFKTAAADLNYGGGKMVIYKQSQQELSSLDRKKLMQFIGQCVESLNGRFITGMDSGTTLDDIYEVSKYTKYVSGYRNQSQNFEIDPAYFTAIGLSDAIDSAYAHLSIPMKNSKALVKGIGNVGERIVQHLVKNGADVYINDLNQEKVAACIEKYNVKFIDLNEASKHQFDLFSPCDIGPSITSSNIDSINAKIIAGAANSQLENDQLAEELKAKGVLYCPDYIINAGGVISAIATYENSDISSNQLLEQIHNISNSLNATLEQSQLQNVSTKQAADYIAYKNLGLNYNTTAQ